MVIRSEWQNWNDSSAKSASNSSFHARRTRPLPALPARAINDDGRGLRSDSRTGEREGRLLIKFFFFWISRHLTFQCFSVIAAAERVWPFGVSALVPLCDTITEKIAFIDLFFSTHFTPPSIYSAACRVCAHGERRRLYSKKQSQPWTERGFYWSVIWKEREKQRGVKTSILARVFLFFDGDWWPLHLNSTVAHAGKKLRRNIINNCIEFISYGAFFKLAVCFILFFFF